MLNLCCIVCAALNYSKIQTSVLSAHVSTIVFQLLEVMQQFSYISPGMGDHQEIPHLFVFKEEWTELAGLFLGPPAPPLICNFENLFTPKAQGEILVNAKRVLAFFLATSYFFVT